MIFDDCSLLYLSELVQFTWVSVLCYSTWYIHLGIVGNQQDIIFLKIMLLFQVIEPFPPPHITLRKKENEINGELLALMILKQKIYWWKKGLLRLMGSRGRGGEKVSYIYTFHLNSVKLWTHNRRSVIVFLLLFYCFCFLVLLISYSLNIIHFLRGHKKIKEAYFSSQILTYGHIHTYIHTHTRYKDKEYLIHI